MAKAKSRMDVESVAISELVPDPRNARKGEVAVIAESLREFGQHRAVVVQRGTNRIIAGNHLTMAAESLGWTHVDVNWVDDDDETAIRRGIADNATGDKARWDDDLLKELLGEVGTDVPGLDEKFVAKLFNDAADEAPEPTHPLLPKPGENYDYIVFYGTSMLDTMLLATLFPEHYRDWKAPSRKPGRSRVLPVSELRRWLSERGVLPVIEGEAPTCLPPMSDVPIVIPSMGRAKTMKTPQMFGLERVEVCVPEAEADAYRATGVNVVAHPDNVYGLSQKRQWIYQEYGDVIMIDDDIVALIHVEHGAGEKTCKKTGEAAYDVCQQIAEDARQYGVYLFGVASSVNPTSYVTNTPFRTTGWVNGGFTGLLKGAKFAYHPGIACAEDFWISALNAHFHRRCWVDTRYALLDGSGNGTMRTEGGMALVRTLEAEERDNVILRKAFGDEIRPRRKTNKAGALHGYQRSFTTPW